MGRISAGRTGRVGHISTGDHAAGLIGGEGGAAGAGSVSCSGGHVSTDCYDGGAFDGAEKFSWALGGRYLICGDFWSDPPSRRHMCLAGDHMDGKRRRFAAVCAVRRRSVCDDGRSEAEEGKTRL